MPTKRKKKAANPVLPLCGELTIYRALELKQTLLDALAEGVVELDLSGVTEIDSAGVQLLMLAKRAAHSQQKALALTAHSAPVLAVFDLFNLSSFFGDPVLLHSPTARPAASPSQAS